MTTLVHADERYEYDRHYFTGSPLNAGTQVFTAESSNREIHVTPREMIVLVHPDGERIRLQTDDSLDSETVHLRRAE